MSLRLILFSTVLFLVMGILSAQGESPPEDRIELGQPEELQGVGAIFVDAGPDAGALRVIVGRLQKKLPDLRLANRPEEADVVLEFRPERAYYHVPGQGHIYVGGGTSTPVYTGVDLSRPVSWAEYFGSGLVYRRVAEDRIRVLADYAGDNPSGSRDHHPKKFTDAFIKAWRKANGK